MEHLFFLVILSLIYAVLVHGLHSVLYWPSNDVQILLTLHIIIVVKLPLYNFTHRLLHLFTFIQFPHVILHASDLTHLHLLVQ
jgi:hypothetical protein